MLEFLELCTPKRKQARGQVNPASTAGAALDATYMASSSRYKLFVKPPNTLCAYIRAAAKHLRHRRRKAMAASLPQLSNRAGNSADVQKTLKDAPRPPRASFLTDPVTSRDLFGVCRGRCTACTKCGQYQKLTSQYSFIPGQVRAAYRPRRQRRRPHPSFLPCIAQAGRRFPDNDPTLINCSRCGCPSSAHEQVEHEQVLPLREGRCTCPLTFPTPVTRPSSIHPIRLLSRLLPVNQCTPPMTRSGSWEMMPLRSSAGMWRWRTTRAPCSWPPQTRCCGPTALPPTFPRDGEWGNARAILSKCPALPFSRPQGCARGPRQQSGPRLCPTAGPSKH